MTKQPKHTPLRNDDAFEREAAEGFGMLGSEEEIAALKAETDQAFAEQLDQSKKEAKAPWLWMAAAFVIVGLGLTLFSVLSPDRKMDVAQAPHNTPVVVPSDAQVPAETPENTVNEGAKQTKTKSDEGALGLSSRKEPMQTNASSKANEPEMDMEEAAPAAAAAEPQLEAAEIKAPDVYVSSSSNAAPVSTPTVPLALNLAADKAVVERKEEEAQSKKMAEPKALKSKQNAPAAAKEESNGAAESLITYAAGVKELEADAQELLKNIQLPKELAVHLFLDQQGRVLKAEISSKKTLNAANKLAAETELKKLSFFIVITSGSTSSPYHYTFTLKR